MQSNNVGNNVGNTQGANAPVTPTAPQSAPTAPQSAPTAPTSTTSLTKASIVVGKTFAQKPVIARTKAGNVTFAQWAANNAQAQTHLAALGSNKRQIAAACFVAVCRVCGTTPHTAQLVHCNVASVYCLLVGIGHCLPKGSTLVSEVRVCKALPLPNGGSMAGLTGYIKPAAAWWQNATSGAVNSGAASAATSLLKLLVGENTQPQAMANALWAFMPTLPKA